MAWAVSVRSGLCPRCRGSLGDALIPRSVDEAAVEVQRRLEGTEAALLRTAKAASRSGIPNEELVAAITQAALDTGRSLGRLADLREELEAVRVPPTPNAEARRVYRLANHARGPSGGAWMALNETLESSSAAARSGVGQEVATVRAALNRAFSPLARQEEEVLLPLLGPT